MMLHKENIGLDSHCAHAIREHVQGKHELNRSNTNYPRTLDCLCLRRSCNKQTFYDLLNVHKANWHTQ